VTKSYIDRENKSSEEQMRELDEEQLNIEARGGKVKNIEFREKEIVIHWEAG